MWLLWSNKAASVGPPVMEGIVFSGIKLSSFYRSRISQATIAAYLATEYRIQGDGPLVLRIGQQNEQLAALYKKHAVKCAAVITAWNPYSEPKPDAENRAAQARLIAELDRMGLQHQPGHGADPTGQWPPEDSRLVFGLDFSTATSLCIRFGQNGYVWAAADAEPTLVLLQ